MIERGKGLFKKKEDGEESEEELWKWNTRADDGSSSETKGSPGDLTPQKTQEQLD